MDKKGTLDTLNNSTKILTELLSKTSGVTETQNELTKSNESRETNQVSTHHGEDVIAESHIAEDKEANALTMQIKIDGTRLKGQSAIQALEIFDNINSSEKEKLAQFMDIVQKNPPQTNEKIGEYFVRLANEDLIEIDDNVDMFINFFK